MVKRDKVKSLRVTASEDKSLRALARRQGVPRFCDLVRVALRQAFGWRGEKR